MPPALRQFLQAAHAVMCPRHLARHRQVAPTDQFPSEIG
jgi:hypothetical protein